MRLPTAILILLIGGVIGLQAVHERRGGVPAVDSPDMLYVRSPEAMKRLALSYQSLLADVYWIRAVQHYGGTRLSNDPNASYDLLYPLLDLTTSLDPRFNVAYLFGSSSVSSWRIRMISSISASSAVLAPSTRGATAISTL